MPTYIPKEDLKISRIEKLYGKDFGIKTTKELGKYLRKKKWKSLAELLKI